MSKPLTPMMQAIIENLAAGATLEYCSGFGHFIKSSYTVRLPGERPFNVNAGTMNALKKRRLVDMVRRPKDPFYYDVRLTDAGRALVPTLLVVPPSDADDTSTGEGEGRP